MIASIATVCLVLLGFIVALLAYSALGNPDRKEDVKGLLKTHRILEACRRNRLRLQISHAPRLHGSRYGHI